MRLPLSALLCALWVGPAIADDWPTLGHDPQRSGAAGSAGPSKGRIVWGTETGDSVDGSPVVVGDRVYVGNAAGELLALRRDTGEVIWRSATGGAIAGAAEVAEGRVFVGSADGMMYAFAAEDGRRLWRHRTLRPIVGGPTATGGKVIFGSMDGTLRAVDPATGRLVWKVSGAPISASCAVNGDVVYYGDEEGGVHAVHVADGRAVWDGKLTGRVIAAPTVAQGKLLVPLMSLSALGPQKVEYLTAWALDTGTKLWCVEPAAASVMGPVCVAGNLVWAFTVESYTSDGHLRGIDLASGAHVAEAKMGALVVDAGLVAAGDTLYMAAQNGALYFMDARYGSGKRRVQMGGKMFSSPAVADGRLYVGCQDGKVYCVE